MPTITITDALGNKLSAELCDNGDYWCPFCKGPVMASDNGCRNPMCEANPACSPAGACKILEARAKNAREQAAHHRMLARRGGNAGKRTTLR